MNTSVTAKIPLVSIILPTLNSRKFLSERIDSILSQTLSNWELIVVDSNSSDGTVEYIKEKLNGRQNVKIFIRPKGLYEAWNFGIQAAIGEYIYIATSDDTMTNNALRKMSDALNNHLDCGICDTQLAITDYEGKTFEEDTQKLPLYRLIGEMSCEKHIRYAPFDAIVYSSGVTAITSMAQAMFRRDLFLKVGYFLPEYGPRADFEWGFRATLVTNVVYIPEKLTTWRRHSENVTGRNSQMEHARTYLMFQAAFGSFSSKNKSFPESVQFVKIFHQSDLRLRRRALRDHIRSGFLLRSFFSSVKTAADILLVLYQVITERLYKLDYSDIALDYLKNSDSRFGWIQVLLRKLKE